MKSTEGRSEKTKKSPCPQIIGTLEKRWGELRCAHSYEGAASVIKIPNFPKQN